VPRRRHRRAAHPRDREGRRAASRAVPHPRGVTSSRHAFEGPERKRSGPSCLHGRVDSRSYIDDLADFVAASPSSYHAAAEVARRLVAAEYTLLDETADWTGVAVPGARLVLVRDGAVVAIAIPESAVATTP